MKKIKEKKNKELFKKYYPNCTQLQQLRDIDFFVSRK